MNKISCCEVCGFEDLELALDLGAQPMCDDLVPIGNSQVPNYYPIEILGCRNCFTFHQAHQVQKQLLFPKSYHYRAALTSDVLLGMEDLVEEISYHLGGLRGKRVIDVGCNDGSLLSIFRRRGAYTYGIEPTGAFEDAKGKIDDGDNNFFDADTVAHYLSKHPKPDLITFTNVFAHIENLPNLLKNVSRLLGPQTQIVIENHYMGAVADQAQFDTFYHEHPRTYSRKSFEWIASNLGLSIQHLSFPNRYNGNIRVIMGPNDPVVLPYLEERDAYDKIFALQNRISEGGVKLRKKLKSLAATHGPLPAKAFPGRACINIHTFGIDETMIQATYERPGSPKIGHYIPGTKIEIRDEREFFDKHVNSPVLVNLAWHIRDEIERYMRGKSFKGEIVDCWL